MAKNFAANVIALGGPTGVLMLTGSIDPTTAGGVAAAVNSVYYQTSTSVMWQKCGTADTDWVPFGVPPSMFGDGSDGDVTLGAGTTTLTKDTFYNNLTIPAGSTLKPAGFKVYVRGQLINQGTISADGNNGAASAGGSTVAAGSWGNNSGAGGSSTTTNGGAGGNSATALPGFTGVGGIGGTGTNGTAGAAGTVTSAVASRGSLRSYGIGDVGQMIGLANALPTPGAGGGGGAGSATGPSAGGGGGGGGGLIHLFARVIDNTSGAITAKGGNGASTAVAGAGGGGGGGGGLIVLAYHFFTGTAATVAKGTGGTGGGAGGGNGADGGAGTIVTLTA